MWLHIPSTSCRCAVAQPASTSASDWRFRLLAQSAGWNGKCIPPRFWFGVWNRERWMTRLCGRICEPSMADRGAASWIASLRAIRASRFQPRVSDLARMIRDTFGLTSDESWMRLARRICSARMLEATSLWDSSKSPENYTTWAVRLLRRWSARQTWRLRIAGSGSSFWPTIRGEDSESCGQHPGATDSLNATASMWPTPCGMTGMDKNGKSGAGGEFAKQVTQWKTPNIPTRGKEGKEGKAKRGAGGVDLQTQVDAWPTPRASDHKGSDASGHHVAHGYLTGAAERTFPLILPAQPISMNGGDTSKSTRRLNPRFVESLMGWPVGWTDIDGTDFGSAEMESYLMRRLSHLRRVLHSLTEKPHE